MATPKLSFGGLKVGSGAYGWRGRFLRATAAGWVNATTGTALKVSPTQWQVQV
jgi:hypothetical protein